MKLTTFSKLGYGLVFAFVLATWLGVGPLLAAPKRMDMEEEKESRKMTHEAELSAAYILGAKARTGNRDFKEMEEVNINLHYVGTKPLSDDIILRFGLRSESYAFGRPPGIQTPNTLQTAGLVLGADFIPSDKWSARIEVYPGFYSDFEDLDSNDINAPILAGVTYTWNDRLRLLFGFSFDPRRDHFIVPGVGVWWKISDKWTLDFVYPKPRLEYQLLDEISLYGGFDFHADTFRVSKHYGDTYGRPDLDNQVLDYLEVRGGFGANWTFRPGLRLELEVGSLLYREFNFHQVGLSTSSTGLAPYTQVAVKADF